MTSHKSEVKARLTEWQKQFKKFGWKLVSLSEDISESIQTFFSADIVVTTAYRWEVTSRAREIRKSLKASKVSIIIYLHNNFFKAFIKTLNISCMILANGFSIVAKSHGYRGIFIPLDILLRFFM